MNIFVLDLDFKLNAQYHVDQHVVKMPTEAAQMLCTIYRLKHGQKCDIHELTLDHKLIYKKDFYVVDTDEVKLKQGKLILLNKKIMAVSHPNHPCTLWAGKSKSNWLWLRKYALSLNKEWQYRYGHIKNHLAINRIIQTPIPEIPDIGLTDFVQAMPDIYKNKDAVTAYRQYYFGEKQHLVKYRKRNIPSWLVG